MPHARRVGKFWVEMFAGGPTAVLSAYDSAAGSDAALHHQTYGHYTVEWDRAGEATLRRDIAVSFDAESPFAEALDAFPKTGKTMRVVFDNAYVSDPRDAVPGYDRLEVAFDVTPDGSLVPTAASLKKIGMSDWISISEDLNVLWPALRAYARRARGGRR